MADIKSIPCPECTPSEIVKRFGNKVKGYWDIYDNIAKCTNCRYERPYHRRKRQNDKITPSQQKAIERIKHCFKDWRSWDEAYKHDELHKFEVELTDYGTVFVSVEDVENYLIQRGGHFSIGRRGGIKVHQVYGLSRYDGQEKHYAKMLGGKIGW